jgi:hypothetical protein
MAAVIRNMIKIHIVGFVKFLILISVGIPGLETYATGRQAPWVTYFCIMLYYIN